MDETRAPVLDRGPATKTDILCIAPGSTGGRTRGLDHTSSERRATAGVSIEGRCQHLPRRSVAVGLCRAAGLFDGAREGGPPDQGSVALEDIERLAEGAPGRLRRAPATGSWGQWITPAGVL